MNATPYSLNGKESDENVVAEQLKKLEEKLDAYEVILSKQKYLAGNVRTSIAHLKTISTAHDVYDDRVLPSPISSIWHLERGSLREAGSPFSWTRRGLTSQGKY